MPTSDESVLLKTRPHPWLIVRIGPIFIIGAFLPVIISIIFSHSALGLYQNHSAAVFVLILWWLLLIGYCLWNVRRWLSDSATVTSSRVALTSGGLNAHTEYSLPLDKIDTARVTYSSRLNRLMKLGTVELKSGDQAMTLRQVYHPEKIVATVTKAAAMSTDVAQAVSDDQNNRVEISNGVANHIPLVTAEQYHRSLNESPIETWTAPSTSEISVDKSNEDLDEMTEGKAVYF